MSATDHPPGPRRQRQLLAAGDRATFEQVYADHVRVVFTLALRLTGDRTLAEDVTSETFLIAWRRRESVAVDDRPLTPWLLGIAARSASNATRTRRRRVLFESTRPRPRAVRDVADEVVGRLDDRELLRRVRAALAALTDVQAEVVALCVWSELSYADAADALGVSVSTVRSRLADARARLRATTLQPHPAAPAPLRTTRTAPTAALREDTP